MHRYTACSCLTCLAQLLTITNDYSFATGHKDYHDQSGSVLIDAKPADSPTLRSSMSYYSKYLKFLFSLSLKSMNS